MNTRQDPVIITTGQDLVSTPPTDGDLPSPTILGLVLHFRSEEKAYRRKGLRPSSRCVYLESYVEVEEADGSLLPQLVLLLHPAHLHDAQRLRLGGQGLHAEGLQTVLQNTHTHTHTVRIHHTHAALVPDMQLGVLRGLEVPSGLGSGSLMTGTPGSQVEPNKLWASSS